MKEYVFTKEEMVIIMEALCEYQHALIRDERDSKDRGDNYRLCDALRSQFKADIILTN